MLTCHHKKCLPTPPAKDRNMNYLRENLVLTPYMKLQKQQCLGSRSNRKHQVFISKTAVCRTVYLLSSVVMHVCCESSKRLFIYPHVSVTLNICFSLYAILTKVVTLPCLVLIFTRLTWLLHFKKVNIAFVTLSWVMLFPSKHVIIAKKQCFCWNSFVFTSLLFISHNIVWHFEKNMQI